MLSRSDIIALAMTPREVISVVEQALGEQAAGTCEMHPKIGVHPTGSDPANFIHAMPAYLRELGACGLKWVSGFVKNYERGLPNVTGVQVYNDTTTGVPLAIMDCSYLTGLRTAAVSAIVVKWCASSTAQSLALVGCGFEGTMHLSFLTREIPALRQVRLYDIRREAMVALKETAAAYFEGEIVLCPDDKSCIDGADIILTCTNGDNQIIRPEWFKPGALGVAIEGGCAYTQDALHQADKFIVDDIALAEHLDRVGRDRVTDNGRPDPEFPGGMPRIYGTICELVSGQKHGRDSDQERIIATPLGMAICDVALAHLAYHTALNRQIGQKFQLA